MTTFTNKKTVGFMRPFVLVELDEALPADAYSGEKDEEFMQDISFPG